MSSVDNRIVNMKFDNAAFERGVSTTMNSLDKLEQSLQFKNSGAGLAGAQAAIDKFHLGPIEGAVTRVSASFIAMSTVAITALSNITNKAISAGTSMVKALTLEPIGAGFREYELKMGSIQTIMAGSGESLKTVNKYLQQLNEYSDQTIYSFADMTTNIGKFTNAGISLKDSVASIKGVANVAALSGANADEASRAMYNFAQALSAGSVKLADWKSIELANMGTKEFKQELIDSAVAAGTLTKGVDGMYKTLKGTPISAIKGFNESLTDGWLTTEALTDTLGRYSDKTTDVGKRATAAASDIKTFSQMLDTLKESAGSGWAETWELVFGDFEEGKKLWTGLGNFFGDFIKSSADARNKILGDWKKLDGQKRLIKGIKDVFGALGDVIRPIMEAFRDIFPPITGKRLAELTYQFRVFARNLRLGEDTINNIKRTFKGLFAIFSIAKQVITGAIGAIVKVFGTLFSAATGSTGGLLSFTANIGDFLSSIDTMLKKGKYIETFFETISDSIAVAIGFIKDLVGAVATLFTGADSAFLDTIVARFEGLGPVLENVQTKIQDFVDTVKGLFGKLDIGNLFNFGRDGKEAGDNVRQLTASVEGTGSVLDSLLDSATNVWNGIRTVFEKIGQGVKLLVEGFTLEETLAIINSGFFILLYNTLRKFIKSFGGLVDSFGGMYDSISGTLDQVTDNLKTMQKAVRAEIIKDIAISLALLAGAIFILSKVDTVGLAKGLVAIAIMLKLVNAAVDKLSQDLNAKDAVAMGILSVGLIGLATAILILAGAVAILGNMDWQTLAKGLTSVVVIVTVLKNTANSLDEKAAGRLILMSAALIVLSVGLTALSGALLLFAALDTGAMIEGGLKIAIVLAVISQLMKKMPKGMVASAAGILILGAALYLIAGALALFGQFSPEMMAKSLTMLAGSLLIIAVALNLMSGALSGAAAIAVFALALNLLIPPLLVLANLSWAQLGMALVALAAIFVVLGVAALVMTPVIPMLFLLAASVALLGAGMLLAGVGMLAFAAGLSILAVSGAAAITVLTAAIAAVAGMIPLVAEQIGLGFVAFAKVIGDKAPLIMEAGGKLLDAFIDKVREYLPKFWVLGFDLIEGFLDEIIKRMPDIIDKGGDVIVAFIEGMGAQQLKIITAAGEAMLTFLEGITKWLQDNKQRFHDVGYDLASAIIDGLTAGIIGLASAPLDAVGGLVGNLIDRAKGILKSESPSKVFMKIGTSIPQGMAMGIDDEAKLVDDSIDEMSNSAIDTMQETVKSISDAMALDIDVEPVIAPVLDLTKFREGASAIQSLLAVRPVAADVSFDQAAAISSTNQPTSTLDEVDANGASQIVFEQNNYSPKALSPIEIYRNTRNQISMAKEVLAV